MAQKEEREETSVAFAMSKMIPTEFIDAGQKWAEAIREIQKQSFSTLEQTSKEWMDRCQSEIDLASEFATKISAARPNLSTPFVPVSDVATAYNEWLTSHMKLMIEDGQRLVANSQKLAKVATKALSSGASVVSSSGTGLVSSKERPRTMWS